MDDSVQIVCEVADEAATDDAFTAQLLYLNAKLDSDLNWKKVGASAKALLESKKGILWDIDLGLFSELPLPLSDTTQYKSLHLALDHFFESLYKSYEEQSIGAIIFKGSMDLTPKWNWDPDQIASLRDALSTEFKEDQTFHNQSGLPLKNLFELEAKDLESSAFGQNFLRHLCMRSALDYFEILSARFPPELVPHVCFDVGHLTSTMHILQLLDHEPFEFLQLALKGTKLDVPGVIGWQTHAYPKGFIGKEPWEYIEEELEPNMGILIPENKIYDQQKLEEYDSILEGILSKERTKFLFERSLAVDWEGLDNLFVFECGDLTKRKLEGFIAAGGQVITKEPLGLSEETSFESYQRQMEVS